MKSYHFCLGWLFFHPFFHSFHFFIQTPSSIYSFTFCRIFKTLNHKSLSLVLPLVLHSTMFLYLLLGLIVVFGCNIHQTQQLVSTSIMVICEMFECYCECCKWISKHRWRSMMVNFPFNLQQLNWCTHK
jgi:hypothetical protein